MYYISRRRTEMMRWRQSASSVFAAAAAAATDASVGLPSALLLAVLVAEGRPEPVEASGHTLRSICFLVGTLTGLHLSNMVQVVGESFRALHIHSGCVIYQESTLPCMQELLLCCFLFCL